MKLQKTKQNRKALLLLLVYKNYTHKGGTVAIVGHHRIVIVVVVVLVLNRFPVQSEKRVHPDHIIAIPVRTTQICRRSVSITRIGGTQPKNNGTVVI